MGKVIEVKLGHFRGSEMFDLNNIECQKGDMVILDVNKQSEFGEVVSDMDKVCDGKTENMSGKILRKATEGDVKQIANNAIKAKDALNAILRKIDERKLDMQVAKAEYTFDSSKIIFFFTAEDRVDFRNLVKDLAKIFRVRIELKQIGVRDKAKIIGGYGVCGRELCCSSYMKGFHNLSIKMAKEQGLPLNPTRISGVCGRIKCCMAYEFEVYRYYSKNLPHVGDKVTIDEGKGKVIDVNILKRIVMVSLEDGRVIRSEYAMAAG